MITKTQINLLGNRDSQGSPPFRFKNVFKPSLFILLFAFILIGFEVAFLVTFYNQLSVKEKSLEQRHLSLKTESDSLQKDIEKLKNQKETFDPQKDVSQLIERLKSDSQNLVKILEAVSNNLPTQAWIHHLSQKDHQIIVNGVAIDNEAISHFLSQLKNSNHFKNVKLVIAEHQPKKLKGKGLKAFTISCAVAKL